MSGQPSTSAWPASPSRSRRHGSSIAVCVAAHDERAVAERDDALERLARPRTGDHVAAEDDPVDVRLLDLGEHRVERRQVAVDVVERRDPHYTATAATCGDAGCIGSRGPAQTTSSAGQPAQAYSLGVGRNSPARSRAIAAESSASSSATSSRVNAVTTGRVRPFEELVDDLDLVGAGAEARERVDEPLEPVRALDDLLRLVLRRATFVL